MEYLLKSNLCNRTKPLGVFFFLLLCLYSEAQIPAGSAYMETSINFAIVNDNYGGAGVGKKVNDRTTQFRFTESLGGVIKKNLVLGGTLGYQYFKQQETRSGGKFLVQEVGHLEFGVFSKHFIRIIDHFYISPKLSSLVLLEKKDFPTISVNGIDEITGNQTYLQFSLSTNFVFEISKKWGIQLQFFELNDLLKLKPRSNTINTPSLPNPNEIKTNNWNASFNPKDWQISVFLLFGKKKEKE